MAYLRGHISSSQTSIPINDTTNLPVNGGIIQIEDEIIIYTTATDVAVLGCTRGANSSVAAAHDDSTLVDPYQDTHLKSYVLPEFQGVIAPEDMSAGILQAPKGSRYTNTASGLMYVNTGTLSSPNWEPFAEGTAAGASGPAGAIQLSDGSGSFTNTTDFIFDATALQIPGSVPAVQFMESAVATAEIHKNPAGGSLEIINQDGAVFLESDNGGPIAMQSDDYASMEDGSGMVLKLDDSALTLKSGASPYISFDYANGSMDIFPGGNTNTYLVLRGTDQYLAFWSTDGSGSYHGTLHSTVNDINLTARGGRELKMILDEGASNVTWTYADDGILTLPTLGTINSPDTLHLTINGETDFRCEGNGTTAFPGRADGYNEIKVIGDGSYFDWYHNNGSTMGVRINYNANSDFNITTKENIPLKLATNVDGTPREWVYGTDGGLKLVNIGVAPAAVEGTLYYDSATHHLYVHNGTTWKQCDN